MDKYEKSLKILTPSEVEVKGIRKRLSRLRNNCNFVLELAYALRYHLEGLDRDESGLSKTKMEAVDLYQEIPKKIGCENVYSPDFYSRWAEIARFEGLDVKRVGPKFGSPRPSWFLEGKNEYHDRTPGNHHPNRPHGYVKIAQLQSFYIRSVQREMKLRRGEIKSL